MKGISKRELLIYLIGFIIARAAFFDIDPLAIGYFTAVYLSNTGKRPSVHSNNTGNRFSNGA